MQTIVIIGPAYPLRGGLATFDERLARELQTQGYRVILYSFSLQYPDFLFPGKTQYASGPAPVDLDIRTRINSINPLNWLSAGRELKQLAPDMILVRYWLPLMGPALGTIVRLAKRNRHTRIISLIDNILPHEKRPGDVPFTRYFLKYCDAFVTMSKSVFDGLRRFENKKPAIQTFHPLYDSFGSKLSKAEAREFLQLEQDEKIVLFFGFIRKYKGLDMLLEAWKEVVQSPGLQGAKLLIAGEFYDEEKKYTDLITQLSLQDSLIMQTDFIPQDKVKYYFCAADLVVQPYRSATQSGITPMAYYFEIPMVVTDVGSLTEYVQHEQTGLVARPEPVSIASAIKRYFDIGEAHFLPAIREAKQRYSWNKFAAQIVELFQTL